MNWTARTVVRLFLLVGGGAFLVMGALSGDALELILGALGVVLGAAGLVAEFRGSDD
ncbi:hypothetical protein JCM18237_01050 [Halorubrum luteum]